MTMARKTQERKIKCPHCGWVRTMTVEGGAADTFVVRGLGEAIRVPPRNRMWKNCTSGSVPGAAGDRRPYGGALEKLENQLYNCLYEYCTRHKYIPSGGSG
jgi:hypothetical protein